MSAAKKQRGRDAFDILADSVGRRVALYEQMADLAGDGTPEARRARNHLRKVPEAEAINAAADYVAGIADALADPRTTVADREILQKAARAICAALEAKS